jgi:hypothetical protein
VARAGFFSPYKVGRLLSPETQFKRTWSKSAHFHVTEPPPRPHRRRFVALGRPGRRRALPKPHQLVSFGCVDKRAPVNWRDLGVSNAADPPWSARAGVAVKGPIANWSDLGVEKWSLRTGQSGCVETAAPQLVSFGCVETFTCVENAAQRPAYPPLGPLSTGQIAHHQLAKFECRKIYHNFPSNRRKRRFESLENGARRPRCPSSPPVCDQRPQRQLASWECVENARPAPRPVPRTGECPRRRDSGPVRPGRPPPPPSARRCRGP